MHRVPRKGNDKKERRVPVHTIYKIIDANEILIQVPPSDTDPSSREARGSWILDAQEAGEEIEYRKITTRSFHRTYRSERYSEAVRGTTIEFPNGITRAQPRKVALIGHHVTKVKASDYEEEKEKDR